MGRPTGNIPGEVLKTITEEHGYLGQFVEFLKQRIELDRKHLDNLEQLHQSIITPAWSESAIWPLVEPILEYFSKEVASRREMCELVDTCVKALPEVDSPDLSDNKGTLMTQEYEELHKAFEEQERCRTEASSLPSITELKTWYGFECDQSSLHDLSTSDLQSFHLPDSNRTYRQSVFQQQQKSTKLSAWHDTVLPDRLEAHQQQSEDIKKTMTKIFTYQSDLYVKLVNDLGLAKDKTQEFSSSGFISEAFESQQLEAGHLWMQPASYMDLETGESSETVIFGTDKEREVMSALLNMILEGNMSLSRLQVDQIPRRKETIKLEQQFRVTGKVNDTLSTLEDRQLGELFCLIGLSQSPLVPIQDDEVKRYAKNPVPRDKIQPIMDRAIHRRLISDLMTTFRAYGYLRECCTLLTHRAPDDVKLIMLAISDKWDFESHRPLPKRVVNKYEGGTAWNLWGKTGGLYDPSRKDSY